jgi:3'-phosphoadenosine 5'-phosphosulfate sulfotransferase (PAPS reductase)/FAD synthetase
LTINKWNKSPKFLGVRYGESAERDERLNEEAKILSCTATGECGPDFEYNRAISKPNLLTYGPIKQWKACAIWDWLTIYAPKYGFDNSELVNHYNMHSWLHDREHAIENGMDESQSLRYGCWYCPMVYNDKTAAHLAKENPKVAEMMEFADKYLRRGGYSWKKNNREILYKFDGTSVSGTLDISFCEQIMDWFNTFESKWGESLLLPWQKMMIESILEWRRSGGTIQDANRLRRMPLEEWGLAIE